MKLVLILVLYNNEALLIDRELLRMLKHKENLLCCLVDNQSTDNTLELLKNYYEWEPSPLSVVEIKKHSSFNTAKKAGLRFMKNHYHFKHYICIDAKQQIRQGRSLKELLKLAEVKAKTLETTHLTLHKEELLLVD